MIPEYLNLRRVATVLRDNGGYDLGRAEMNPVIFEEFIGYVLDNDLPPVIWEPFSSGIGRFHDMADEVGVQLIAHTLGPHDARVLVEDSTERGPECQIGGMLFHPTYYGSPPLASVGRAVGHLSTKDDYIKALKKTADFARLSLSDDGAVCAIGRDYRVSGERVRLDEWYLDVFSRERGFNLAEVWMSEPDVVLIFRKIQ